MKQNKGTMCPDQEDEEDEKDVGEKEDGPQDAIGLFDLVEIKVAENRPQQGENGI